jgi:hypothetical protein
MFLTKLDTDALLSFLNHCDTHNMHKQKFWLIASNLEIQTEGNDSCMCMEVQGYVHPTLGHNHIIV